MMTFPLEGQARPKSMPSFQWKQTLLALSFCGLATFASTFAQQVTRTELGLGYYTQSNSAEINPVQDRPRSYAGAYGPFVRLNINLNRSIALETSAFDSVNLEALGNKVGGHEVLVLGGIKAGVRRQYAGVFGRLDAGAASYSRALEFIYVQNGLILDVPPLIYRKTHFALEPGATVEAYVSPRTILRADIDENLNAVFRTIHPIGRYAFQYLGGDVPHHLALALSVEHRFGGFAEEPALRAKAEHASVGAYFPLQIRGQMVPSNAPALGGGGAWFEIPMSGIVSADLTAFDLPHDDHTAGYHDGGTPFSAFVGPKVGFHLDRFGVFGKIRPGVTRFSRTISAQILDSSGRVSFVYHPQYQFSVDTGGVFEYTLAKYALLRLEAGDTLLVYHAHSFTSTTPEGSNVYTAPPAHSSSMLFLAGVGFRF